MKHFLQTVLTPQLNNFKNGVIGDWNEVLNKNGFLSLAIDIRKQEEL